MLSSVLHHLHSFQPADHGQLALRDSYVDALTMHREEMLWKGMADQHITASCFVLSPDLEHVLLTHHRKGGFWVQFGGHLEEVDGTLDAAAAREAREESGIADLEVLSGAVDLDRHELHGGFTCAAHWDVGFAAICDPRAEISVSDESESVAWWAVDSLPENAPKDLPTRIGRAIRAHR